MEKLGDPVTQSFTTIFFIWPFSFLIILYIEMFLIQALGLNEFFMGGLERYCTFPSIIISMVHFWFYRKKNKEAGDQKKFGSPFSSKFVFLFIPTEWFFMIPLTGSFYFLFLIWGNT